MPSLKVSAAAAEVVLCSATVGKTGVACTHPAKEGGLCGLHRIRGEEENKAPAPAPAPAPAQAQAPAPAVVEPLGPPPPLLPRPAVAAHAADVAAPAACRKLVVLYSIRGDALLPFDEYREKVGSLVRDGNISKHTARVGAATGGPAAAAAAAAAATIAAPDAADAAAPPPPVVLFHHDYYLRSRRPTTQIQVDHTFECQFLGLCIVNSEETHDVLRLIDLKPSRTHQPSAVVRNFFNPLYSVHNDLESCLNLRLLDSQLNQKKGAMGKSFVHDLYKARGSAASAAEDMRPFVRMLEEVFETSDAVKEGLVDAGTLAHRIEMELASIEDDYTRALEDIEPHASIAGAAERRRASERFAAVAEQGKMLFGALGITRRA
jgi:hypothetical protein